MRITNFEYLRELPVLGNVKDRELKYGYLLEFDGMAPLWLTCAGSRRYGDADLSILRQGNMMKSIPIHAFRITNVEPFSGASLGLYGDEWFCNGTLTLTVSNKQAKIKCTLDNAGIYSWDGSRWAYKVCDAQSTFVGQKVPNIGLDFLNGFVQAVESCEDLIPFMSAPARHHEFVERGYEMDIGAIMVKVNKKKSLRDKVIEKKTKAGGLELK